MKERLNKIDTQKRLEFIYKSRLEGITPVGIAQRLHISKELVSYYLKKLGLTKDIDWTLQELDIIKIKYSETKISELSKLLPNRSLSSIRRKAFELGIKKNTLIYEHCSPQSKLQILLEDTPISFYWIGFLFADGWIYHQENTLGIGISLKDEKHLLKYAKFIQCSNIQYSEGYCGVKGSEHIKSQYIKVIARDKELVLKIIEKFDFKSKKTYNPPSIALFKQFDLNLLVSFIIGFIDGDGCINSYMRTLPSGNKIKTTPKVGIECHHSWKDFLNFMVEIMEQVTNEINPLPKAYIRQREGKQDLACIKFNRISTMQYFKKFIIDNNLPVLERKWDKVNIKKDSLVNIKSSSTLKKLNKLEDLRHTA